MAIMQFGVMLRGVFPQGEDMRARFATLSHNEKSVALDLKAPRRQDGGERGALQPISLPGRLGGNDPPLGLFAVGA